MKNNIWITGWALAALILVNSPALFADVVQGEIRHIDPQGTFIEVTRSGPLTKEVEPESTRIFISEDTQMTGAVLGDLRPGDSILAEVERSDEDGSWVATNIQLDKVDIQTTGKVVDKSVVAARVETEQGGY